MSATCEVISVHSQCWINAAQNAADSGTLELSDWIYHSNLMRIGKTYTPQLPVGVIFGDRANATDSLELAVAADFLWIVGC